MPNFDSNTSGRGELIFYNQAAFSLGPSDPVPWPHAGWLHWRTDLLTLRYWDGTTVHTITNSADLAAHEADTTAVHGIADTADLALVSTLAGEIELLHHFTTPNASTTKTLVSGETYLVHLGRATKAHTQIDMRIRVPVAAATITWAEACVYSGAFATIGTVPLLTRCGFADVAAIINGTGVKDIAVTTSGITAGMDLWWGIGNNAVTAAQLRAGNPDATQSGFQLVGTFQPSATSSTTPSLEGATQPCPWGVWKAN